VYVSIANQLFYDTITHFLDLLDVELVQSEGIADIIITDNYLYNTTNLKVILLNCIKSGPNSKFWAEMVAPFRFSQLISLLNRLKVGDTVSGSPISDPPDRKDLSMQFPLSILIAEDNTINQKFLVKSLLYYGYIADIANNGQIALDKLKSKDYDLIFMDVQMPVMDGLEATRIIKANNSSKSPIIIAMTANALDKDREMCINAGMDGYVSKPIRVEYLEGVLLKWGQHIHTNN
jgi:CheY-like chemotaxis protein